MIHGVLNVYKEKGFTSHDVVAKLRKITGQKKIGHTGTLDPDAEGVLPVCLGRATKLCDMLTDKDKTYETVLLLGCTTDTQDISGRVTETRDTGGLCEAEVREAVEGFIGEYAQVPPMYSALKVNGKKLYELAREGKEVERKARTVRIYEIGLLEVCLPRVRMRVRCSKGTYIRTLCFDIGKRLGCGGCMEELIRTQSGRFVIEDSLRLNEIARMREDESLMRAVIPVDEMFGEYEKAAAGKKWDALVKNGNPLPREALSCMDNENPVRVYDESGQFIAVYRWQKEKKEYHVLKMFYPML
ncbi:tRNA pseudouridine(55) synthase TruB [Lachnospiraceae bacterium 62-26]